MSFGPKPWQQQHWDWRAAGNFICGGVGGGLLAFSALTPDEMQTWFVLAGLALVGAGLFFVWLEIGRPLRAIHVMFHPQRSWMTREAFVAALIFPCGLLMLLGWSAMGGPLAVLGLVFLFCQGRIISAAKGIPAWREPLTTPLIMTTGIAEALGLVIATSPLHGFSPVWMPVLMTLAMLARLVVWHLYRKRLTGKLVPRADAVLDDVGGRLHTWGSIVPLLLLGMVAASVLPGWLDAIAAVMAGGSALLAGSWLKFCLITRAGFNQGFALVKLPVRGVPRER